MLILVYLLSSSIFSPLSLYKSLVLIRVPVVTSFPIPSAFCSRSPSLSVVTFAWNLKPDGSENLMLAPFNKLTVILIVSNLASFVTRYVAPGAAVSSFSTS